MENKDLLSAWVSCPVSLAEGDCLAKTSGAINPAEKKLRNSKKEESRIIYKTLQNEKDTSPNILGKSYLASRHHLRNVKVA